MREKKPRHRDRHRVFVSHSTETNVDDIMEALRASIAKDHERRAGSERSSAEVFARNLPPPTLVSPTAPPSLHWVEMLTPAAAGCDFVRNIEELYFERWLPRYGARTARNIMVAQGIQFVARQWLGPFLKLFGRLKFWGLG